MEPIHIMRPGTHTSSAGGEFAFPKSALASCAANYNPKLHEAPIVVGHPKDNGPAYGWVSQLQMRDDGLYAIPRQVNAEFADVVRSGAYKKVSGAFYRPDSPNNPTPGSYYLRHVGFLGAAAPAVKGLHPVEFADVDSGIVEFEEDTIEFREWRLAEKERAWAKAENTRCIEHLVKEGRLPIGLKDDLLTFMDTLSDDTTAEFAEFAEAGDEPIRLGQRAYLKKFLSLLPVPVITGEIAKFSDDEEFAAFAAPDDYKVDEAQAEIHRAALAYQQKTKCSYADAVLFVARGK